MDTARYYPLLEKIDQVSWQALNWFFPTACVGCGKEGISFCPECLGQAPRQSLDVCALCGDPLPKGRVCPACAHNKPTYRGLRAYGLYDSLFKEAVHQLKYHRNTALGLPMSQLMWPMIDTAGWVVDAVVPIPLGAEKLRQRGYNQAHFLARPIALHLRKPYLPNVLIRLREVTTQTQLTAEQREANVRGAFLADPKLVLGKKILLVDDVFTTGATMRSASEALIQAGAAGVYAATFAKAGKA